MGISIIGSGVVGRATGIGLHMKGHDVVFYDIDKGKLDALRKMDYRVTDNIAEAVQLSDTLFLCVPTPTVNRVMDFGYVEKATLSIAKAMSAVDGYKIVVVKSTVLPSTTRCKVVPLLERHSELNSKDEFGVCVNPEFLTEKNSLHDFLNPSRIVIGELDERSGDFLEKIYSSFGAPIIRTNLDNAEMIKYVSNIFLAAKISFFNEIFIICQELGLDADLVSEAASLDPRIGKYGIHGGRPFDGKCLPKDVEAFINFVQSSETNPKLLEAIALVNDEIAAYVSRKERK